MTDHISDLTYTIVEDLATCWCRVDKNNIMMWRRRNVYFKLFIARSLTKSLNFCTFVVFRMVHCLIMIYVSISLFCVNVSVEFVISLSDTELSSVRGCGTLLRFLTWDQSNFGCMVNSQKFYGHESTWPALFFWISNRIT